MDLRRVEAGGDDVGGELVVQDAAVPHRVLLDQRVAEALHHAALDLALAGRRVDDAADVVAGPDARTRVSPVSVSTSTSTTLADHE